VDPAPVVAAEPPSGSTFPVGKTVVRVTATDAKGNSTECSFEVTVGSSDPTFLRGNSNGDPKVDISDAVYTLRFLFMGEGDPPCLDAADVNDDGEVNITDPIYLLSYLFQGGPEIPAPGALEPGIDGTPDQLGCGLPAC
jgi:hypothetical protein